MIFDSSFSDGVKNLRFKTYAFFKIMLTIYKPPTVVKKVDRSRKNKKMYTIHLHPNRVWAVIPDNSEMNLSVMSFKNQKNAEMLACMFEENKRRTGEWPELSKQKDLHLPISKELYPEELMVSEWSEEDLNYFCATTFLDMICINDIKTDKMGSMTLVGASYKFNVPLDFYKDRLDQMYDFR
jgi:hypothetical protein